jgi:hypothetical protein
MKKKARGFLFLAMCVVTLAVLWIALKAHLQQRSAREYLALVKADGGLGKYRPPNGFVPDKETAIAIAVAAWQPIFGKEIIEREAPYQANLVDGIWVVSGTGKFGPDGTAKALIRQNTGEILQIDHEL